MEIRAFRLMLASVFLLVTPTSLSADGGDEGLEGKLNLKSVPRRLEVIREQRPAGIQLYSRDLDEVSRGIQVRDRYRSPEFRSGEERRSEAGRLDTSLSVRYATRKAWRPATTQTNEETGETTETDPGVIDLRMRTYDGLPVGPTLRVKAGDVLTVRLKNQLPNEVPEDHSDSINTPHHFNHTNLHTHGLHVSPIGNSDNVLIDVGPGEDFLTEVVVPPDHLPGTFWYHAHVHGSTAMQVSNGMAGALIIEPRDDDDRALDNLPEIRDAEERVCVFQQIAYLAKSVSGTDSTIYSLEDSADFANAFGPGRWNEGKIEDGWRTTINGQLQPIIHVESGKLQRFRFIHAGVREVINVQISEVPQNGLDLAAAEYNVDALNDEGMREIAVDGIPLEHMVPTTSVELYPGYRSDVLLKLTNRSRNTKRYVLWDGLADTDVSLDPLDKDFTKIPSVLAVIEVRPQSRRPDDEWPSAGDFANIRRPEPINERELTGLQVADFRIQGNPGGPPSFLINNQEYDPDAEPLELKLGRADRWQLSSQTGGHPFHIHVNPFYVASEVNEETGAVTQRGVWRDTLLVRQGTTYNLRTRYQRYIGDFVIHCHILDHEDRGMMSGLRVSNRQYEIGTKLANPYLVPLWTLPNNAGDPVKLADHLDEMTILVFLESLECPLCNRQIQLFEERFDELTEMGVQVVFVAPDKPETEIDTSALPFPLVFDEDLTQYRAYKVTTRAEGEEHPLHGVFVLDENGRARWREIADEAYLNLDRLVKDITLLKDIVSP